MPDLSGEIHKIMRAIKNIRLPYYNYTNDGYYFITICTNHRHNYLAEYYKVLEQNIANLQKWQGITVEHFVIMPNHLYLIIKMEKSSIALGEVIRRFKAISSKETRKHLWQPNYYEHVIRTEKELEKVRLYLKSNSYNERIDWKNLEGYLQAQ